MKIIDLEKKQPSLAELIILARRQNLLLKTAEGQEFVLAEVDDFAKEVALVRRNKELQRLLARRSREKGSYSLAQVKKKLGLG